MEKIDFSYFERNGEASSASDHILSYQNVDAVSKALNTVTENSESFAAGPFSRQDIQLSTSDISEADSDSVASSDTDIPMIGSASGSHTPFSIHATNNNQPSPHKSEFLSTIDRMTTYVQFNHNNQPAQVSDQDIAQDVELLKAAPIFTSEVGRHFESLLQRSQRSITSINQFGLLGLRNSPLLIDDKDFQSVEEESHEDDLVIANMDMPWSAFICGSQGAGKSHTLSCLLENALLKNAGIGRLPNPLAAMVFHYDNYTNATCSQTCEAAYLCTSGIPVTVLVSPSNIWAMTKLYKNLPGLPSDAPKPRVLPLYLSESLLDISTMLKLMAIDPSADSIPLYMETVMSILREMAMEGKGTGAFSYSEFRTRLEEVQWAPGQLVPLNLRLQLLDSFLEPTKFTRSTRPAPAPENIWAFEPGTLTIVDLSDPFVNSNDACSLFSICLSLFMDDRGKCGRIIALDEAHKFLLQSGAAKVLTADLTSVIRQQRHTGTRVVIATQEPTLSPDLIDLSNATFVHRFLSPAWYDVLRKHLAGANKYDSRNENSLFETIVSLQTGEALLFCPTALTSVERSYAGSTEVKKLGNGYLRVRVRKRVTADGGRSILASETNGAPIDLVAELIPMHVVNNPPVSTLGAKGKGKAPVGSAGASGTNGSAPNIPSSSSMAASLPAPPAGTTNAPVQVVAPVRNVVNVTRSRLRDTTRLKVGARVTQHGWSKLEQPQIETIIQDVESTLSMVSGSIKNSSRMYETVIANARIEFAKLRPK